MNLLTSPAATLAKRAALVLTVAAASTAAHALPTFGFDPNAAGLNGAAFTADNLIISNFSTVTFTSATTFTDTGFFSISAAQLGGAGFTPSGLNSSYGLYVAFSGSGTTNGTNPVAAPTFGSFSSLTYTLYGYNGSASFGFSGNTPTTTAAAPVALASGSLVQGSAVTVPNGDGTFTPFGNAKLTVNVLQPAFFASPAAFYDTALSAFSNTSSQVEVFANGFRIRQGGGSINFASAVPEPESYAMLLAGVAVLGFVARRRRVQH